MDAILGTALIKAINWYIDEEPLTLIRHHLPTNAVIEIDMQMLWRPKQYH